MTETIQGNLALPDRIVHGQVVIRDGRISKIIDTESSFVDGATRIPDDHLIAPGFIDVQINGAFGKEFKSDADAIPVVCQGLPKFGTTSFCPTVTTKPFLEYPSHLRQLKAAAAGAGGAKWIGFHLEGPFLNPGKVGAQAADLMMEPIDCDLSSYVNDDVRIVTFSPELDGGEQFIKDLVDRGLRVGVGHSLISYEDLVGVFDASRMMIVHVYNAMSDLNSRNPGVLGAALDRDDYFCSIIADGIHVSPPSVRVFWKCKQDKSKVMFITDGSAVAGLDEGIHQIGTRSIEKRPDRAVLEGTETLVGSILTLNVAVRNMIEFTGCPTYEAINCASRNPAQYLGLSEETGELREGLAADIAILDSDFNVTRTYVNGKQVWG
ncbi:N-acetylglucosamine-6-phosphate deacetylase [Rhizobium sp. L1K21]|uniref:N-acetylglucosamine-6-phosphate deacetylase n=1 Tax=Rhizobium sp. L1K21 TaxID=2954933 RepID=UPI002092AAC3|nr:N-acetylglucosamine-6-phosphate deacetylase [Rhizobium sp. L1K21]MCO6185201.1 N-acetylglucosamine-6-phosphate deacetylase [Rhizobium sp. L1K21]